MKTIIVKHVFEISTVVQVTDSEYKARHFESVQNTKLMTEEPVLEYTVILNEDHDELTRIDLTYTA